MTEWILLGISLLLVLACGLSWLPSSRWSRWIAVRSSRPLRAAIAAAIGVQSALRSLSTQLSGAQVGITITNLVIGFLAEPAIAQLVDGPLESGGHVIGGGASGCDRVRVGLSTALTMIYGELVPKNLAIAAPLDTARATQRFIRTFTKSNAVPIRLLNGSANALVRRLGMEPQEELRSARSSTELASLIARSAERGTLIRRPPS